jgi:hypothetical protein
MNTSYVHTYYLTDPATCHLSPCHHHLPATQRPSYHTPSNLPCLVLWYFYVVFYCCLLCVLFEMPLWINFFPNITNIQAKNHSNSKDLSCCPNKSQGSRRGQCNDILHPSNEFCTFFVHIIIVNLPSFKFKLALDS